MKIIIIPYHAAHYLNYILNRLLITGYAKYVAKYIDAFLKGLDKRSGKEIKYIAKRMKVPTDTKTGKIIENIRQSY